MRFSILINILVVLYSSATFGQEDLKLSVWKVSYLKNIVPKAGIPTGVVVTEGVDAMGFPLIPSLSLKEFNQSGFLKAMDLKNPIWNYKLNNPPHIKATVSQSIVENLIQGANAQLLFTLGAKNWELKNYWDKKIVFDHKAEKGISISAEELKKWLDLQLGYHGVALEFKNGHILVANMLSNFKPGRMQALALADSALKTRIGDKPKGLGLFSIVESDGPFAVFKVIMLEQGVTAIESGTKLILEVSE